MNHIRLRKNNLCVENLRAYKLVKKYRTPFYCYSLSQLKNNYHTFNSTFRTVKPIICFSVKSNSNLTLLRELKKIGINVKENNDGMVLTPTENLNPAELNAENDHRLFMAFSIIGMYIGDCSVTDPDSVKVSYPDFITDMKNSGGKIIPV